MYWSNNEYGLTNMDILTLYMLTRLRQYMLQVPTNKIRLHYYNWNQPWGDSFKLNYDFDGDTININFPPLPFLKKKETELYYDRV